MKLNIRGFMLIHAIVVFCPVELVLV